MSLQGRDHRRSSSVFASQGRRGRTPPAPPPRSAPATCRRPRRAVGDRVFVTSPTAVLIEFRDENSNIVGRQGGKAEKNEEEAAKANRGDVAKFRNRSEVDGLEWQELDIFIGKRLRSALCRATLTDGFVFRVGGTRFVLFCCIYSGYRICNKSYCTEKFLAAFETSYAN